MVKHAKVVTSGKMTKVEYVLLHQRVNKQLGQLKECENCGTKDAKSYDWANISGEYKEELSDWARLCRLCHGLIDGVHKVECVRGHLLSGDNIGIRKMKKGWGRYCKKCNRQTLAEFYERKKAKGAKDE